MISSMEIVKVSNLDSFLETWKKHTLGIEKVSIPVTGEFYATENSTFYWNDPVKFFLDKTEILDEGELTPKFTLNGKYIIKKFGGFICSLFPKSFNIPLFSIKEDLLNYFYNEFGNNEVVNSIDKPEDIQSNNILPLVVTDFDLWPTFSYYHNRIFNKAKTEFYSYYHIILYINGRKLLLLFDIKAGIFFTAFFGGAELYENTQVLLEAIQERVYKFITLTDDEPEVTEYLDTEE